jgi:hypothetical protein
MKYLKRGPPMMKHMVPIVLLLVACALPAFGLGTFDSDTEVQAPSREGEQPVIFMDMQDPTYNVWQQM